jgi:type IV secretion system protein VirD4
MTEPNPNDPSASRQKEPPEPLLLGWNHTTEPEPEIPVGFCDLTHEEPPAFKRLKRKWACPDAESHLVTIAPTGAGKGRSAIIPTCLTWSGGLIVIDPKGEAVATTARHRRERGHKAVVIDPFGITGETSDRFNPFDIFPHTDMSVEEMSLFIPSLLHPDSGGTLKSDPFWDLKSDSLIAGICGYALTALEEEKRNIPMMRELMMGDDPVYRLAVALDTVGKKIPPMAYQNISAFLGTEDKCRSGILATAQQHFEIYGDPRTAESVSSTTFDLAAFKRGEPMTIYLVLPPSRLYSHRALLRLWVGALLTITKSRSSKPEHKTLFIIDEAAQLGRMNALVEAVTLLRGYGVRTWSFWQSRRQLDQIYGADAGVILDNSGIIQCFGFTNLEMAGSLSGLLGEGCSAQELLRLPRNKQLILTPGGRAHLLTKLDYLKDRIFSGRYDLNPIYRERDDDFAGIAS